MKSRLLLACVCMLTCPWALAEETQLYWGDTHLHTSNSFDAYLNGNWSADPETAYRYAKGLPVIHPHHRGRVQIETPLDFLVIADHAELLGIIRTINETGVPRDDLGVLDAFRAWYVDYWMRDVLASGEGRRAFVNFLPEPTTPIEAAKIPNTGGNAIPNVDVAGKNTWMAATELADKHYEPGKFTSLIGWEWSSIPGGANLHRVVFTTADAEVASGFRPFSLADSQYPEDLWAWLEKTSAETNAEFVAIPHNSNISKGFMFPEVTIKDVPVSAEYAKLRATWEPVVEVTQYKGDSETHASLSPEDKFADFETYTYYIEQNPSAYDPGPGDYARSGMRRGLKFEDDLGVNPFKFGVIGSTDAHTGLPAAEETNFHGKMATDSIPENKVMVAPNRNSGWAMSAQGLAAAWASENTREGIMAAFKRREVYATTGPRIQVRMFGGWQYTEADVSSVEAGYTKGVPMGGDLTAAAEGAMPGFIVWADRDPLNGNLDRIQIVKGWLDADGQTHEKVFNIAWSGDRAVDENGHIPDVGSTVDLTTGGFSNTIGSASLSAFWTDPEFNPQQRAFYYARVLQIPTARHSLADALAMGMDKPDRGATVIQERAYTSSIWYTP